MRLPWVVIAPGCRRDAVSSERAVGVHGHGARGAAATILAGAAPWLGVALLVVVALQGLVTTWLFWMSLRWPLVHDAPILHYIAWRIGEGAVPYRDVFDMNQPGAYLIHLAVLRILGDGDLAWRLFDLGWLAAAAAALYAFARPWGVLAARGAALLFALYHLASGAWQTGQRDFLTVPALVAGALGVAGWLEDRRRGARWLGAAGLALGAAVTVKPHAAAFVLALAVAIIAAPGRRGRLGALAVYGGGVLGPPALVLAWLAERGAVGAWWEIATGYLVPYYARLTRPEDWGLYRWHVWIPLGAGVALSVASALRARRFGARHAVALTGAAYGLAHFLGQGKGWEYHLYPLAAFVALVVFSEIEMLARDRALGFGLPLVVCLATACVLLAVKGVEAGDAGWIRDKERGVRMLVSDLEERLAPGDTVQVLDTAEGGIHALLRLRRRQPTRFIYDFHFQHDVRAPRIQRLRAEFARDLAAHPPRFIVVFERAWPAAGYDRLDRWPELSRWLTEHYAPLTRRPGYLLLAQRGRP